jgi:hypothetical protein
MAEYALPPGAVRRRTVFGLLDADGWAWATVKATFWFLIVIFLLGYVPDRAYYFTVSPTVDVGYNAISPVNLCPAENDRGNRKLPCPPPAGSVVPWESSPAELALPAGRSDASVFTSGENLYLIGGVSGGAPTASVLANSVGETGNLDTWQEGPALPEPRTEAAMITFGGTPYVVGGAGADGAPTDTVFRGVVEEGLLTGWEAVDELTLPVPLADAAGASAGSGLFLFGGRSADGLSARSFHAELPEGEDELEPWAEMTELPLPEARADHSAAGSGGSIYVLGGEGPQGISNMVYYLGLDTEGHPAVNPDTERPFGWGVSVAQSAAAALPEPRSGHTSFINSGAVYVIGGVGADGLPVASNYWTVPSATNGNITRWQRQDATDLLEARVNPSVAVVGQYGFIVGGATADGESTTSERADMAPRRAFFRLGLFGLTVPALSIKGEIGQQLGYIVAGSAAIGNFVLLVVIGWMYSHKRETFRFFQWVTRGRFRAPPDEEYHHI